MKKSYRKGLKVVLRLSPFQARILSAIACYERRDSIADYILHCVADNVVATAEVSSSPAKADSYFRKYSIPLCYSDLVRYLKLYCPKHGNLPYL